MLKAIILHKPCIYDEPLLTVMQEHAARSWSSHLSLSSYGFLYVWVLKEHKPENPTSSLFYWRLSTHNVVLWRKTDGFERTKAKVPNVTWPQGFVGRSNKWPMHQVDISLCQSNVHNCSKIKSLSFLSLSIHFRTTQHWAMQKHNRGYQLMQQKVQEVERRPCRSITHLFSEGAPVLSWLTCALGKTKTWPRKNN